MSYTSVENYKIVSLLVSDAYAVRLLCLHVVVPIRIVISLSIGRLIHS